MEIIITSASRPECLKSEMKNLFKFVEGEFKIYLHEDVVPKMENKSKELIDWSKKSNYFEDIIISDPRVGRGYALNKLKKFVKSDYILYLEDDWDFKKHVNLKTITNIMDNHNKIKQACFIFDRPYYFGFIPDNLIFKNIEPNKKYNWINKPAGPNDQNIHIAEERIFDKKSFFVSERWQWMPAIWRTEFVLPKWDFVKVKGNKEFNNKLKNNCGNNEWNNEWLENNIGSYFFDKYSSGEIKKYVKHNGYHIRHDREFL